MLKLFKQHKYLVFCCLYRIILTYSWKGCHFLAHPVYIKLLAYTFHTHKTSKRCTAVFEWSLFCVRYYRQGPCFSAANFAKFRGAVCEIPRHYYHPIVQC